VYLPAVFVAIPLYIVARRELKERKDALENLAWLRAVFRIQLGITVVAVVLIAAIAIPSLFMSGKAENASATMYRLRVLKSALNTYFEKSDSYPETLKDLVTAGLVSQEQIDFEQDGYRCTYSPASPSRATESSYTKYATFTLAAVPMRGPSKDEPSFYLDQAGQIVVLRSGLDGQISPIIH
jgi:type II secretory pathway pseudopilin PulG